MNKENICKDIRDYLKREESIEIQDKDINIPLNKLGLDSVAALGLGEYIDKNYQVKAPQSLIYDHPTLERISEFIIEQRNSNK